MEFLELAKKRFSVRKFEDKPVEEEKLQKIMEAGRVAPTANNLQDYKTILQEIIQRNPEEKVEYVLKGQTGPDHDRHFIVEVCLNSNVIGHGEGHSKKQAEQQAAKEALRLMGEVK